jgi:hypothetical protein
MAAKKGVNMVQKIGSWAFILGIVIALIAGFWPLGSIVTAVLILLGLIVGFLNVTGKETTPFLLATVSLVIVSNFGGAVLADVSSVLQNMLSALIVFVIPATIVVAVKAVWNLAASE